METLEDTVSVEGTVLWLVQCILANLLLHKFDEWLRQIGLAAAAAKLRTEVERAEAAVSALKGAAFGNMPLARSLGRLRELLYDTDDMVDELDYYRLQHQVEGVPPACADEPEAGADGDGDGAEQVDAHPSGANAAGIPSSSDGKKRSKAWDHFTVTHVNGKPVKAQCNHCGTEVRCETSKGTSVLHNHLKSQNCKSGSSKRKHATIEQAPNPSSAGGGAQNGVSASIHADSDSIKRMRMNEVSTHCAAADMPPWNKADFCNRIQQMTRQLQEAVSEVQKLYVARSDSCMVITSDPCRRTSSVIQRKIYGRVAERDSIIEMITRDRSDDLTILPIVGIGGIGKTALAQLVYNDPAVERKFEHRIWVYVSDHFNITSLTRRMLGFVAPAKQKRFYSFAKLQEVLVSHIAKKRVLLVLDDVWDNMNDRAWNKMLAPLKNKNVNENGNVVLVTTRNLSFANGIGTVEPAKLGAYDDLQNDDFWLLFRACAFGDDRYEGHPSLDIIGRKIVEKLHGNPLAAETVGMLLREHLTIDHWNNILKKETWKSLQLSGGIMLALKLSYDKLPYYLQQCFLHCSIFPKNYRFGGEDLVRIWISQGFVKSTHSSMILHDTGRDYLNVLVNSGLLEQAEGDDLKPANEDDPTPGSQTCYVVCGLMHDFARLISRTCCAAIDGPEYKKILPTVRHLSIVTDPFSHKDQYEKSEEELQNTLVRKLRTLVLIGSYKSLFFRRMFQEAHGLRMLRLSATNDGFDSFLCEFKSSTHLRYLKLKDTWTGSDLHLPCTLNKYYHLLILDAGGPVIFNSMNGLMSMQHLFVKRVARSSATNVTEMSDHQDVNLVDQNSSHFKIRELQPMNDLVQLAVYDLQNADRAEACGAKLKDKRHLESLHLSWEYSLSQPCEDLIPGLNIWSLNAISSSPNSEQITDTSRDVLESLEPCPNLKHLRIFGYSGSAYPAWLATSVTCLQTLHLCDCRAWRNLPSLDGLPFLTKLKLESMQEVLEVTIPSLEELVLIEMPKLERCSFKSVRALNFSLKVLEIKKCPALKTFPLFESGAKFKIEPESWLSHLSMITIHDCPNLTISHPLPSSSRVCKISIARVSTLPTMEGISNKELTIGKRFADATGEELKQLDAGILSFNNLKALSHLTISRCQNLLYISLEGFRQLSNLKRLEIAYCYNLFSSHGLPEGATEDVGATNFIAFPSLRLLAITFCRVTGEWLSVMLQHAPTLEALCLDNCDRISGLLIEGKEDTSFSNPTSSPRAPQPGKTNDALTGSTSHRLLRIPSNLIPSLKRVSIENCRDLIFQGNKEDFSRFTSLEDLEIVGCPQLISSWALKDENNGQGTGKWLLPCSLGRLDINHSPETLQPCFPNDLTRLKILVVRHSPSLKSLQLHSCTTLEELRIVSCDLLAPLEGLNSLGGLRILEVAKCPGLKSLQLYSCTAMEKLLIDDCDSLDAVEGLHSLSGLRISELSTCPGLKSLQLHSCTALEKLTIVDCDLLAQLEGLNSLGGLKILNVAKCPGLKSLQLHSCTAMKELLIDDCDSLNAAEGLHSLSGLRILELFRCPGLKSLQLHSCTALEKLRIVECDLLAQLEGLNSLGGLKILILYTCPDLKFLQLHSCTALEELRIVECDLLAQLEGLNSLGGLRILELYTCPGLKSLQLHSCTAMEEFLIECCDSLDAVEGLHSLSGLRILKLSTCPGLKFLQLHSYTALEELSIDNCALLASLEGLNSLGGLWHLIVFRCPLFPAYLEHLSRQGYEPFTRLETLEIDDFSFLTKSFCEHLTSLRSLQFSDIRAYPDKIIEGITIEQDTALQLLTSLQELRFAYCPYLADLPMGLHGLRSLKRLVISSCPYISGLPQRGLPPSLEELLVSSCSLELTEQCRMLATSKLTVKIFVV